MAIQYWRLAVQFFVTMLLLGFAATNAYAGNLNVPILVFKIQYPQKTALSRLELATADLGFAGAQIGQEDNATTGAFLGQDFTLTNMDSTPEAWRADLKLQYDKGSNIILMMSNAQDLLEAAKTYPDALFFNVIDRDNSLRAENCMSNILHIAPSQNMVTDAVAQYAVAQRWSQWFLVYGSHAADIDLADSYRRSATKFGLKIVLEREFTDVNGARQTDTGHVLVQKKIPIFTQTDENYDIMVAADASDEFASYLPYHLWNPRPVVGSAGLRPLTWTAALEAWGATQIQRRFEKRFKRLMREEDYQAWLSVRILGEAVTRIKSGDSALIRSYLLSDDFEIAAFKGVKLNFRDWDGQLRQPLLLGDERMLVSVSPQEGYLHRINQLDTLGIDRPETKCQEFKS